MESRLNMEEKFTSEENLQIRLKEYEILAELRKHQSDRVDIFNRTFLTANAIVLTAISFLLKESAIYYSTTLTPLLSALGFILSLLWLCIGERITTESELINYQLRYLENKLTRNNDGIFTSGKVFFDKKKLKLESFQEDPVTFFSKTWNWFATFKVKLSMRYLAVLFLILFSYLFYISITDC
jgi:hypothetical protein